MKLLLFSIIVSGLSVFALQAKQAQLEVALANPYLEAEKPNSTYLKVGLTGFTITDEQERTPVNVALVIDRSSSMSGAKMAQARDAAAMAVNRLQPDDIVSIIAYDSSVEVLVQATKLTDKPAVLEQISRLKAKGSTALFAGVSRGAVELRKFIAREKANRVILLSDGQANVGPKSPGELAELGAALVKEGIAVTTIGLGLGYNEDLMTDLAAASDGNHVFVENEKDLLAVFDREFGDILSVVAQEVVVDIKLLSGVTPKRVIGRKADINGQKVTTTMNQLYSDQEKYVILEVDVEKGAADEVRKVAEVGVSYANMFTNTTDELTSKLSVRFSTDKGLVEKQVNKPVMANCVLIVATETNKQAVKLRDEGKIEEAHTALIGNADYITLNAVKLGSKQLENYGVWNGIQAGQLDDSSWALNRKVMRAQQVQNFGQIGHGGYQSSVDVRGLKIHNPNGFAVPVKNSGGRIGGDIDLGPPSKLDKATKDEPYTNWLGMKLVPVPITGGATDGKRVLFSIWETRISDYEKFVLESNHDWLMPYPKRSNHPATRVSWEDCVAFCKWLTKKEREMGWIRKDEHYRLPTDHEWSCAVGVGVGGLEDANLMPPQKKSEKIEIYPWGKNWPPPAGSGNFKGVEPSVSQMKDVDDLDGILPVGSFALEHYGLKDLSGNVWEWCEEMSGVETRRVLRGGAWSFRNSSSLNSTFRGGGFAHTRFDDYGFRCVLSKVNDSGPSVIISQ